VMIYEEVCGQMKLLFNFFFREKKDKTKNNDLCF
jgi:hypothetical protein